MEKKKINIRIICKSSLALRKQYKVASAIEKIFENQPNFGSLYEEVMKIDGYEENMPASTFDHMNWGRKTRKVIHVEK